MSLEQNKASSTRSNDVRHVHEFGLCSKRCVHGVPSTLEVERCRAWLRRHAYPRKVFNVNAFSYVLKHRVEEDGGVYVSNGAFITAALLEGYAGRPCDGDSPNAYFAMGFKVAA